MTKEIVPMAMMELEEGVTVTLQQCQDYGIMLVEIKGNESTPDKEYLFQSTQEMGTFGKCWELDTENNVKQQSAQAGIYSLEQELKQRGSYIQEPGYNFKKNQPIISLATPDATYWLGYLDSNDPEAIGIEVSNYQTGNIITTTINKEGEINQYYDYLEPIKKVVKPSNQKGVMKTKSYPQKKRSV